MILPADEIAREVSDSMFSLLRKNLQNLMFDTVENALVVFWTGGLLRKLNGNLKNAHFQPECLMLILSFEN